MGLEQKAEVRESIFILKHARLYRIVTTSDNFIMLLN